MKSSEQLLWSALRPAFRQEGALVLRVENIVEDGFPDVVMQHPEAGLLLIELKSRPDAPKKITSLALGKNYGLRQSQKNWWLEFTRHGGKGYIVSQIAGLYYAHAGADADAINYWTLEEFCDAVEICTNTASQLVKRLIEK